MRSKLTKMIALLLGVLMLLPCFVGCGVDEDYTGPILQVLMSDMPTTFDPAYAYLDSSSLQLLSLMYEGLFSYDKDGKLQNALADSWKWIKQDTEKNEYEMEITIKKTCWNDGQTVTADQFVYAWRRLLDPGFGSEAACLLYDIKNAEKVKSGDVGIFAFGATAPSTDIIRIEFDHAIDTEQFFALLASPALVPMRDDIVEKNGLVDWDSTSGIVTSNGPFYLKSYTIGSVMRFERNRYYFRDVEADAMDEYVTPYRLEVNFSKDYVISGIPVDGEDEYHLQPTEPVKNLMAEKETGNVLSAGDGIEPFITVDKTSRTATATYSFSSVYALNEYLWQSGEMQYYSNIPMEYREKYVSSLESNVTEKSTATLLFNTKNELLSNPSVRRALSLAIDRTALAAQLKMVQPAEGLICGGTWNTGKKTDFRTAGGAVVSATADVNAAKELLSKAGVKGGSFELAVKYSDPVSVATAEYLIGVWKELGFTVTTKAFAFTPSGTPTKNDYNVYDKKEVGYDNLIEDYYTDAYKAGNFDVILTDVCQLTTDAFSTLAPFSTRFCGGSIDLSLTEEELKNVVTTHVTGYQSEAYDALIDQAFAEKSNNEARADALHKAEKMLMEDGVAAPLYVYSVAYQTNGNLKGLETNWFGATVFTDVTDKTYVYMKEE